MNNGEIFPYRYDNRHDISVVVTHKFNDRIDVGLVWVFSTGNAVTLACSNTILWLMNTRIIPLLNM
ncbi:MAG: hypothetical protein IPM77_11170 [Crocinitomicaceae bacterium]|nr:hypothetical protein [Crocinitomicaceae bacterium]